MSDRTGVGLVELAVLEEVNAAADGSPGECVVSTRAVAQVEERLGLGPRYGYEVLVDLAREWVIPVPLVSVMGNIGDRNFPEAAGPRHTECRLSRVGQLVLDAEAHRAAPVPVGIINGTAYRGGVHPPLEPFRVLAALRNLLDDPRSSDDEILRIAGPPYSVTGCDIGGDLEALMLGRQVMIRETGKITITSVPVPVAQAKHPVAVAGLVRVYAGAGHAPSRHPAHLVIESLPGRSTNPQAGQEIATYLMDQSRYDAEPIEPVAERPVDYLADESRVGTEVRLLITLRPGCDPVAVRKQLASLHAIASEGAWRFPAPLASMLRSWVDRHRDEDVAASLASLEDAIQCDRHEDDV